VFRPICVSLYDRRVNVTPFTCTKLPRIECMKLRRRRIYVLISHETGDFHSRGAENLSLLSGLAVMTDKEFPRYQGSFRFHLEDQQNCMRRVWFLITISLTEHKNKKWKQEEKYPNNNFAKISSEMDNAKLLPKTDRLVVKGTSGKERTSDQKF
jgi:hypothetical protein